MFKSIYSTQLSLRTASFPPALHSWSLSGRKASCTPSPEKFTPSRFRANDLTTVLSSQGFSTSKWMLMAFSFSFWGSTHLPSRLSLKEEGRKRRQGIILVSLSSLSILIGEVEKVGCPFVQASVIASPNLPNGPCDYLSGICLSTTGLHSWLPPLYDRLRRWVFILLDVVACFSEEEEPTFATGWDPCSNLAFLNCKFNALASMHWTLFLNCFWTLRRKSN